MTRTGSFANKVLTKNLAACQSSFSGDMKAGSLETSNKRALTVTKIRIFFSAVY